MRTKCASIYEGAVPPASGYGVRRSERASHADVRGEATNSNEDGIQQREERLKFDKSRGLFLDTYTGLYYNFAANLYYNLTSMEQASPCYHWDAASAKFLAVLVNRIVRFAGRRDKKEDTSEQEAAEEAKSHLPQPSLGGESKEEEEAEEGEIEGDDEYEDQGRDGQEGEQQQEEDLEQLAMTVRARGLEERQSWCNTEEWKWDATSNTYYDTKTGLYYSPASDLYMDYNAFPAAIYHRLSRDDYVEVAPQEVIACFPPFPCPQ